MLENDLNVMQNKENQSHKNELNHFENEKDFSSAKYHEPYLNENNLPVF